MHSQYPSTKDNAQHNERPMLFFVIGSTFLCIVVHLLRRFTRSLVIVADVSTELAKIHLPPELKERAYLWSLSPEESAKSLIASQGTDLQQLAIDPFSDFSASTGNAALPGVGLLSMQQFLNQPATGRILDELAPRLRELAGGDLPIVDLNVYCTQAGGTSTLGASEGTQRIAGHLANEDDVTVRVNVFVLSSLTFQGKGFPPTQLNAGSGLANWLKVVRQPVHPRITVDVTFGEVCPVGNNEDLRKQLLLQQHTALHVDAVRTRWIRDLSNRAMSGPLGPCSKVRTDHYPGLPEDQILHDIASIYYPHVVELLHCQPAHHLLYDLEPSYEMRPVEEANLELLMQRALDAPNAAAVPEILAVASGIEAIEWSAVLPENSRHPLATLCQEAAVLPESPTAYQQQLSLLLAISELCHQLLSGLEEEVSQFSEAIELALVELMETWEALVEPSFICLKTNKRLHLEFKEAIDEYRGQIGGLQESVLENDSLKTLSGLVDDVLRISFDRLHVLSQTLEQCMHSVTTRSKEPLVTAKPFEECFHNLLTSCLDWHADDGHFEELRNCVASVTRTGLKQMTQAEDSNPDSIVSAVIDGKAAMRGPSWGGNADASDLRFIVYPCLSPSDRELLEAAHARHRSEAEVAFAGLSAATLSITILNVTYCRQVGDLFVPFYVTGLQKALASDLAPLIVPEADIASAIGLTL